GRSAPAAARRFRAVRAVRFVLCPSEPPRYNRSVEAHVARGEIVMATLVLELPASLEQQLHQAAAEAGQNTAEFARAALEEKLAAVGGGVGPSAWRELVRIGGSLPKEERERLPAA